MYFCTRYHFWILFCFAFGNTFHLPETRCLHIITRLRFLLKPCIQTLQVWVKMIWGRRRLQKCWNRLPKVSVSRAVQKTWTDKWRKQITCDCHRWQKITKGAQNGKFFIKGMNIHWRSKHLVFVSDFLWVRHLTPHAYPSLSSEVCVKEVYLTFTLHLSDSCSQIEKLFYLIHCSVKGHGEEETSQLILSKE